MKKMIAVLLSFALLAASVSALAGGNKSSGKSGLTQNQTQTEQNESSADSRSTGKGQKDRQRTRNGQNMETDGVSGATKKTETSPDTQPPADGQTDENSRNSHGFRNGQKQPDGSKGSRGQKSGRDGKNRAGSGTPSSPAADSTPALPDFDVLAAEGVISVETAGKIKAYLAEHPFAASASDDSDTPDENAAAALMNILLSAEIITQEEYDALIAAQTVSAV